MKSFADRIGGILTAPLATLRDAAGEGRGATDVALLIGFKLVAGSTQELAAALSRGIDTGVVSGLMAAISVLAQVLPDVVAILVGGILLSLLARSISPPTPGFPTSPSSSPRRSPSPCDTGRRRRSSTTSFSPSRSAGRSRSGCARWWC